MKSSTLFLSFVALGVVIVLSYFLAVSKPVPKTTTQLQLQSSNVPASTNYDPALPPSQSLKGQIISLSGQVKWQSRTATEAAEIKSPQPLEQGEQLETGDNGRVNLSFDKVASLNMAPLSTVNFAQTLPVDLVFAQSTGSVSYQKIGQDKISIRTLHLLVEPDEEVTISLNKDQPIITVTANKGALTVAFNDSDQLTQVLTIKAGQTFIFNDTKLQGKIS